MFNYITFPEIPGDQFGYYSVGQIKTDSKFEAIEWQAKTGQHLEWHFNRPYYSTHNWTVNPFESLEEMYCQRAQEIRNNYDYVVLMYSGGADSWQVLNSFVSNDIKIDEIAHCHNYDAVKRKDDYTMTEEIFYTAIPTVQKIQEKYPDIKHRVIDISNTVDQLLSRPELKFDYIYLSKGLWSLNALARSFIRDDIADYQNIINSGKKMCFVFGAEKPRLVLKDGKYHCQFIDVTSDTSPRIQRKHNQGWFDEWFYWAPSTAKLITKQCHTLINLLDSLSEDSPLLTARQEFGHCPQKRNTSLFLSNAAYHCAIYPGWDPGTIVAPKPFNFLLSDRDYWFWNKNSDTDLNKKAALAGIKKVLSSINGYWLNDPSNIYKGIKGCVNYYPLE
jgi:hypothetical protein